MQTDPASTALEALQTVQTQLATAFWLSGGMLCASALILFLTLGWRKPALTAGLLYSLTLCFVPVGHARVLGPCGAAAAAVGLLRPRGKPLHD